MLRFPDTGEIMRLSVDSRCRVAARANAIRAAPSVTLPPRSPMRSGGSLPITRQIDPALFSPIRSGATTETCPSLDGRRMSVTVSTNARAPASSFGHVPPRRLHARVPTAVAAGHCRLAV